MGAAWDEALASDCPVVLEVKTDPEVPPLPPHISFEQARNFMSTLQQGDPDEKRHAQGRDAPGAGRLRCGSKEDA